MGKLSTFIRTLKKSAFSFSYYKDTLDARFSFSLKYFLLFGFILSTLLMLIIGLVLVPMISEFATRFKSRALTLFPSNLVIDIRNGELFTNTTDPFRMPLPYELITDVPPAISDQKQTYLLTIDTNASVEDFNSLQTFILLTKTHAVVRDNDSDFRVFSLRDAEDISIDQLKVNSLFEKILPLLGWMPIVVMAIIYFTLLSFFVFIRLMWLLMMALLLFPASQFMGLRLSYQKLYQIGLHAVTLPTLIQIFMLSLGLIPPIPFFFSILFYLYVLVIFAHLPKKSPNSTLRLK